MWISTVTYNTAALRELDPVDALALFQTIATKKEELKVLDGGGLAVPGHEPPAELDSIDPTTGDKTIKRAWNTESAAREFATFADTASEHVTATVEEQV